MSESFVLIAGGGTAGHVLWIAFMTLVSLGKKKSKGHFFTSDREIDNSIVNSC